MLVGVAAKPVLASIYGRGEDNMERKLSKKQIAVLKQHQFKKGEVQQPQGRTAPNKINQHIRQVLALAVEDNLPALNKAIDSLLKSNNEFIRSGGVELTMKLMEFVQPRLSAMAVKTEGYGNNIIVIGKPADLEIPSTDTHETEIQDASVLDNNLNDETHGA